MELRDPSKQTSGFLSSVNRKYSAKMRTEKDRIVCMGKMAHNAISESNCAQATTDLISGVSVTFYNTAAGGMSRTHNDFGRSAEFLVGCEKESIGKTLGTFHKLPPKLREYLMQCARENAKRMKKWYDDALKR